MTSKNFLTALTTRQLLLLMALAAAGMLAVALVSQYGFGLHPCELCHWQRYPYFAIVIIGLAAAKLAENPHLRVMFWLCVGLFVLDAGIALYHAGVEQGIFEGLATCSSGAQGGSLEEMRAAILNAPLVTCGQAMAHVLGLSMAAWNAIGASLLAFGFSVLKWRNHA